MQNVEELLAGSPARHRLLDGSLLVGLAFGTEELLPAESLGVGVEAEEDGLVAQGVLLLGEGACQVSGGLVGARMEDWSVPLLVRVRLYDYAMLYPVNAQLKGNWCGWRAQLLSLRALRTIHTSNTGTGKIR